MKHLPLLFLIFISITLFAQTPIDSIKKLEPTQIDTTTKDELEVFVDSVLAKGKIKSGQELIDRASSEMDHSIANLIITISEIVSFIGAIALGIYVCFYVLYDLFEEEDVKKWKYYGWLNFVVFCLCFYGAIWAHPYIMKIINYFLFRHSSPKAEHIRFTNIYDNILSYYSSVNKIPLVNKLISTLILVGTVLGTIKAVYETYVFFKGKSGQS